MERGCSPRRSRECLHESMESAWMEQDEGKCGVTTYEEQTPAAGL